MYLAESQRAYSEETPAEAGSPHIRAALEQLTASTLWAGVGSLQVVRIDERGAAGNMIAAVERLGVDRLVVTRDRGEKNDATGFALGSQLFRDLPCEVIQLCVGDTNGERCERVLVGTGRGEATADALLLATQLVSSADGQVTAIHVEPEVDDISAALARRTAERIVADHVGQSRGRVEVHVVTGTEVAQGLRDVWEAYDLLLLGATHHSVLHRWLFSSVSERLIAQHGGPTLAVLRPALPWRSRVANRVARVVRQAVPQLDRERRLRLFERIHEASQWNFDFVALISLSTLIATLGLLQDSGAVVIGAMLVAPLMTPLLGIGLAITQGNAVLGKMSARTVGLGFLCSLGIGWMAAVVSGMLSTNEITQQIAARGSPGVTDLLVAFFSGVAAAYAIGRPNLLSALPGVAIAAALVPPVASSAIGLASQDLALCWGAALLFLTNIVAIVLGAAMSFWLSGIRVVHMHGGFGRWSRRVATLLLVSAVILAVYESLPRDDSQRALESSAVKVLSAVPEAQLEQVVVKGKAPHHIVLIQVSATEPLSESVRQQLFDQAKQDFPQAARIEVRFEQVWRQSGGFDGSFH